MPPTIDPPPAARPPGRRRAPAPAYQDLAERLRSQILSGELKPGDRLPVEHRLSEQSGVGRSTVREALRVLSSQRLVSTSRGVSGGTFVRHPDPDEVSEFLESSLGLLTLGAHVSVGELLEVRELLEVPAAGLAAQRRTETHLAALRDTLFDPRHVDTGAVFEANREFHSVLLDAASNPLLELVARPVFSVLNTRFLRDAAPARFWFRVDRDHREILGLVEAGDAAGARAASHAHLEHLRRTYQRIDRDRARPPLG